MTIRADKFTPEVLLSAPRRSAAVPNTAGTLALYSTSTYSFQTHSKSTEIRVLDLKTGNSEVLTKDLNASEPTWLGDENLVLWLRGREKGVTKLMVSDASVPTKSGYSIGACNGPVSNLKTTALGEDKFGIAVTGLATPSGELFNPEIQQKSLSSGKVYSNLFVRHWDSYVTENKNAIWYGSLNKLAGKYVLGPGGMTNALKQQHGESYRLESPVPTFGGADDFDISRNGLIFIAKDPHLDAANHTKSDLYYIPLKTFTEQETPHPEIVRTGSLQGYSGSPKFSPDGQSVAFTRMRSIQYESDKTRLLLLPNLQDLADVQEFFESRDGNGKWDRSPSSILWSISGEELYLTAEEHGRVKLWKCPSSPRLATELPISMTTDGAVNDVRLMGQGHLFLSCSSLVDNSTYCVLPTSKPSNLTVVSSLSRHGRTFGLDHNQISDIWFQGAGDYKVHAWVITPSHFDKSKKYPLAYLIHGGPQGAWNDSWSTRWNPAVFAEQGYVVITPNPTGSTGYGMSLQNGIKNQWGGRPYEDLVKGFEYVEKNMEFVDTSRSVALGASYGGYMMNWIQGHPLGRKFKALVTHDGVFSTLNQICSEELFFPHHDFDGTLWEKRENYERWDPAAHIANWATPHLIIHNELDYRLPISEGLAPFNVLQSKKIPSKFLTFPDENHWVLKPENSLVWHKEVLDWINKYSGIANEQEPLQQAPIKFDVTTLRLNDA